MPPDARHEARQWNLIEVLTQDHRDVEDMFVHVVGLSVRDDWQRCYVLSKIITELVRHSIAEEQHLYPAVRAYVPRGDLVAEEKLAGHATTDRIIKRLDGLDPSDMVFDRWFSHLIGAVSAHFEDEEATVFPLLADACDAGTLRELGIKAELTKRTLPAPPTSRLLI
jgi:hemerythrin superfamily protein